MKILCFRNASTNVDNNNTCRSSFNPYPPAKSKRERCDITYPNKNVTPTDIHHCAYEYGRYILYFDWQSIKISVVQPIR